MTYVQPDTDQTLVRLLICFVAALLLHALLLTPTHALLSPFRGQSLVSPAPETNRSAPDDRREPPLGRDRAPARATLAWIPHDDFRRLQAPEANQDQPALQQKVDPTPDAPLPLDPTAPAAAAGLPTPPVPPSTAANPTPPEQLADAANPSTAEPAPTPLEPDQPSDQPPTELAALPTDPAGDTGPLARADTETADQLTPERSPKAPRDPNAPDRPAAPETTGETPAQPTPDSPPTPAASPGAAGTGQAQGEPIDDPRPTAAARSDREASAAAEAPMPDRIRPGEVITGPGLEIRTVNPQFSTVTRVSALPTNPRIEVTFDPTGKVTEARIRRSSGYKQVDGPVLASLYQWTATGERLEKLNRPVTKIFTIDLGGD